MKLLKISVSGLPLFSNKISIDFLPLQRVNEDNAEKMKELFVVNSQKYYKSNILSFIGINASGKTTVLKLINFIFHMLNNEPIHTLDCVEILDNLKEGESTIFDIYFYNDSNIMISDTQKGFINYLQTIITRKDGKLIIVEEKLKSKSISKITSKKMLYDFQGIEVNLSREINSEFLLDDVSIMVAFNKKNNVNVEFIDMLKFTNINELNSLEECPVELITFFDPSIEYLKVNGVNKDIEIYLKFKDKEEIKLSQFSELNRYLSSGTIKGINTYLKAFDTFKSGGYLLVDELENHFNHEIVSTLIRFYMDKKINSKGATLIFSTHYPELLDEFERNDTIYIVRNRLGITVDNLSNILVRNDIKKSDAYQSGICEGTTPRYDSYMDLKKSLILLNKEEK